MHWKSFISWSTNREEDPLSIEEAIEFVMLEKVAQLEDVLDYVDTL